MGSKANFKQAPVHWPREITKAKLSPFLIHIFLLNNGKRGRKGIFGQVWTSWDKFGQGNKLVQWGKKAEKIRTENKNLSGSVVPHLT